MRRQLRHVAADGRRRHTMRLVWWMLAMVPQVGGAGYWPLGPRCGNIIHRACATQAVWVPFSSLPALLHPAAAADADAPAQHHRLLHGIPHLLPLQGTAGEGSSRQPVVPRPSLLPCLAATPLPCSPPALVQGTKALEQNLEQLNSKQLRDLRDQVGEQELWHRARCPQLACARLINLMSHSASL